MMGGDAAWVELAGRLAAEQIGCAAHPLAPALAALAPPPGADPNPGEGDACIATRDLVLQMEAMARADYFVGTTTSAIPSVIKVPASSEQLLTAHMHLLCTRQPALDKLVGVIRSVYGPRMHNGPCLPHG